MKLMRGDMGMSITYRLFERFIERNNRRSGGCCFRCMGCSEIADAV